MCNAGSPGSLLAATCNTLMKIIPARNPITSALPTQIQAHMAALLVGTFRTPER
jgi:hypothetical protein